MTKFAFRFATLFTICAALVHAHEISFQAGEGYWQLGSPVVGNINRDPALEIVVACRTSSSQWLLEGYDRQGNLLPGFPFDGGDSPINATPTLVDLDGDGAAEILFTCGDRVIALRGEDGSVIWQSRVQPANYVPSAGYQVVTNGFYWSWGGEFRSRLPDSAVFASEVSPPWVADIDGNGELEVLTAWKIDPDSASTAQDYNPFINDIHGFGEWGTVGDVWSGGVVHHDARTGELKFIYHFHQLVESGLAVGQPDRDRALEVFVLNDSDSVVAYDKTQPPGLWGNGMLHRQFGKNQRLLSGSYLKGVDLYAADVDGDGLDELLVPTSQWDPLWQPQETVLDDDGAILWREWKDPVSIGNLTGWLNSACMIPVNPDHDNRVDLLNYTHAREIHFRTWNGAGFNPRPGWPKDFSPMMPTPPVVGDVDGDGAEEIVIGIYDAAGRKGIGGVHVYSLSGELERAIDVPGGVKQIPVLADLDGDRSIELIFRSMAGRIFIHNLGGGPPESVSWSMHRGNARHDGRLGELLYPAGTPRVISKAGGFESVEFEWELSDPADALAVRIYQATEAEGPFTHSITYGPAARRHRQIGLENGRLYFFEVEAEFTGGRRVRSAPFAVVPELHGNLLRNGSFEEDDDSHWDKWFAGDLTWTNMAGTARSIRGGAQAMEVKLDGHRSGSSIKQYNQYGTPDAYLPTRAESWYSFGGFLRSDGFSAETEHWLEWNSTVTGEDTNSRPRLPFPNYFTPPLKLGLGPVPWTYVNRVFQMPPGFPNVELRHRFSTADRVSGSLFLDDLFFREIPDPTGSAWTTILNLGSEWRYTADPAPESWIKVDFDDSGWAAGRAKFGFGSAPKEVQTALPGYRPAYRFRTAFHLAHTDFSDLLLEATCTDNAAGRIYPLRVFLNGTELRTSGIESVSGEGNQRLYFDLTPFASLLRIGENTIAVEVANAWAEDWDTVAFDAGLKGIFQHEESDAPRFSSMRREASGEVAIEMAGPPLTLWRLQSSGAPQPGGWDDEQEVAFDGDGRASVRVQSKTGIHRSRLFRLIAD